MKHDMNVEGVDAFLRGAPRAFLVGAAPVCRLSIERRTELQVSARVSPRRPPRIWSEKAGEKTKKTLHASSLISVLGVSS